MLDWSSVYDAARRWTATQIATMRQSEVCRHGQGGTLQAVDTRLREEG